MKRSLLQYLFCPTCASRFTLSEVSEENTLEIVTGMLACQCRTVPIRRCVPRFVSEESYSENFGYEWKRFQKTQLDSHTGWTHTAETFVQKTGWTPSEDLRASDVMLEVGCGAGRFLEIVSTGSDATVIGIDLSEAVDVSQANVGHQPNVHIVQADVFDLPFVSETFTKIYSIGVLHHTPSTREAFEQLPGLLKEAGEVVIWVYRKIAWAPKSLTHFSRLFTKKMSYEQLISFSEWLDTYWYPVVKRVKFGKNYPLRSLLLTSVFPDKEWRILNNFDAYSPSYNHQHTPDEVVGWFENMQLESVETLKADTTVRGCKPRLLVSNVLPLDEFTDTQTVSGTR